ncbi:hypothetical protein [Bdellovibrio sp. NC01]|uniref:hypothetical protein n=1 Tax=Bdellovibrio sp. NC01 TaxID=2220073 RepID=UPI00115B5729|nr:hypothetical protein [Bdellovibrio sp. NC01]QDK37967.1 hypothetical protein DOE51_10390 [Bdellovibrio sp. NC01]
MDLKEQKIKNAIRCLLISAAMQIAQLGYSAYLMMKARTEFDKLIQKYPDQNFGVDRPEIFGASAILPALMIVATFYVVQDLKKEKGWAWIAALVIFMLNIPSWILPVSVIGLIMLFDERVRSTFLKELDIAF